MAELLAPDRTAARCRLADEPVVTGASWDCVDAIARHAMGAIVDAHPQPTKTLLAGWTRSDNVWKRRAAILAQLRSRQATDRKLLPDVIEFIATGATTGNAGYSASASPLPTDSMKMSCLQSSPKS